MDEAAKDKALLLIRAIRTELALGTKHFDSKGRLLTNVSAVLDTLVREKKVELLPTPARQHMFEEISRGYYV